VRHVRARGFANLGHERLFLALTIVARGLTLPALGLGIAAASKLGARPTDAESDSSYAFRKAMAVIFFAGYLCYLLLGILLGRRTEAGMADAVLMTSTLSTLPFFLVVVLYEMVYAFDRGTSAFLPWTLQPYGEAFMSTAMEFFIVIILISSGLLCPVWRPSLADREGQASAHVFPDNGAAIFPPTASDGPPDALELEPVSPRTQEPAEAEVPTGVEAV
jgi:hypothetical protein